MSFISREIIGKIWESWHTFLLTCKCPYYSIDHMWTENGSFLLLYNQSFNVTGLTAQSTLFSHFSSQNKQTCNNNKIKLLDWRHSHFHTVFDSRLKHTVYTMVLALSRTYYSTSNCIYCSCDPSQKPSFFSVDILEALSVSSMQRVE